MLESLGWAWPAPRCELLAARSFVVVGASQRLMDVFRSRSRLMALLYSTAVRLQVWPVRQRGHELDSTLGRPSP